MKTQSKKPKNAFASTTKWESTLKTSEQNKKIVKQKDSPGEMLLRGMKGYKK